MMPSKRSCSGELAVMGEVRKKKYAKSYVTRFEAKRTHASLSERASPLVFGVSVSVKTSQSCAGSQ
jgi:hypothetical protein